MIKVFVYGYLLLLMMHADMGCLPILDLYITVLMMIWIQLMICEKGLFSFARIFICLLCGFCYYDFGN